MIVNTEIDKLKEKDIGKMSSTIERMSDKVDEFGKDF